MHQNIYLCQLHCKVNTIRLTQRSQIRDIGIFAITLILEFIYSVLIKCQPIDATNSSIAPNFKNCESIEILLSSP